MLGDTIEEIAREKAGIFKKGVVAITSRQPRGAMLELEQHAAVTGNTLLLAPPLESFEGAQGGEVKLGIPGDVQRLNAAVGIGLVNAWLALSGKAGPRRHVAPKVFVSHILESPLSFCWQGHAHPCLQSLPRRKPRLTPLFAVIELGCGDPGD